MIAWYFRLFYIPILNFILAYLLAAIISPKRMGGPELSKPWMAVYLISFGGMCVLMWFVPFRVNLAFWIGICIIVFGHLVNSLAYSAMREHPEKKKVIVDWDIYRISRHPHILHGMITQLGVIVMGWNMKSLIYIILWVYFVGYIVLSHFGVLNEEKLNIKRFGQEYVDYMKRVPRYFLVKG